MICSQCQRSLYEYYISFNNELFCHTCYERALTCIYCHQPTSRVSTSFVPVAHSRCIKREIEQQGYIDMNEKMQGITLEKQWTPSVSTFNNLYLCCYTCQKYKPQQGTVIYEGMWKCLDCQCLTSVNSNDGMQTASHALVIEESNLPNES